MVPLDRARMLRPVRIGGYTDFNAARQHAVNAGTILRGPQNALPVNWLHMPVAYNGRASTVVVSGTPIRRPLGQFRPAGADAPQFGPTGRLDFELEMGAVLGVPSAMGEPLDVAEADAMIFGHVLLNDWSARDIQAWETVPLGPFQGKAFGTSISPWIVTRAALEPFRVAAPDREGPLLPYLRETGPMHHDIALEAGLVPAGASAETVIVRTNARHLHYSPAQMLTQHAIGGCAMEVGDLLGSGTVSGPERDSWACLLEQTFGGREPLAGLDQTWLQDGDTLILRGQAERDGLRIGFGECRGVILPASGRFAAPGA
jgi:fumarylacetoacetase